MIDIDGDIKCLCFVCLFVRVLHANVMQSIMSHCSQPTNGPLLTDTYEFGNVISFSHNFAATFCHFQISYTTTTSFARIYLVDDMLTPRLFLLML